MNVAFILPMYSSFCCATGRSYAVIGGQHGVKIAKEMRQATLDQGLVVPEWQATVLGSCLRHDVPLSIRQAEAGNAQYRQSNVSALPISSTLAFFVDEMASNPERGQQGNMGIAIQKTGQTRFERVVCSSRACGFVF